MNIDGLLAARRDAEQAIVEAKAKLTAAHEAAVEAYRAQPTDETKSAYARAVSDLDAFRRTLKADRPGISVGGDAVIGSES